MYLAQNSRPDIAYAVYLCARFSHSPKQSHSAAVKRILRYLKGTSTKGIPLRPGLDFIVDCYVMQTLQALGVQKTHMIP